MESQVLENTNAQLEKQINTAGLTVTEVARRLSVSESHIWKMLRENKIHAVKFGRRTIVPTSEIFRILNGGAS